MKDKSRFVLMPRLTAASVFFACLAFSTASLEIGDFGARLHQRGLQRNRLARLLARIHGHGEHRARYHGSPQIF